MKNTFILTLICGLMMAGGSCYAQLNPPPPEFTPVPIQLESSLLAAFTVVGIPEPPVAGSTDFVAAVDADDANEILGVGRAAGGGGQIFATVDINPPTGASNSFHMIYYDVSTDLFHVLNDAAGATITAPFLPNTEGSFVEGFEIGSESQIAGQGIAMQPGEMDLAVLIAFLPVELTSFTGRKSAKTVTLDWTTASEDGNDNFSIERSADGTAFVSVGEVAGAGTTREAQSYSFNDESPLEGQNYYRLRQNDFSGAFSYSDVVVVSFEGSNQTFLEVSPNPATDFLQVKISGDWEDVARVVLMDMNGKVISDQRQPTASPVGMELNHLPAGIYQLQVTDGKNKETRRVIVR